MAIPGSASGHPRVNWLNLPAPTCPAYAPVATRTPEGVMKVSNRRPCDGSTNRRVPPADNRLQKVDTHAFALTPHVRTEPLTPNPNLRTDPLIPKHAFALTHNGDAETLSLTHTPSLPTDPLTPTPSHRPPNYPPRLCTDSIPLSKPLTQTPGPNGGT